MRAQKPVRLHAGMFYDLSLTTFTQVTVLIVVVVDVFVCCLLLLLLLLLLLYLLLYEHYLFLVPICTLMLH